MVIESFEFFFVLITLLPTLCYRFTNNFGVLGILDRLHGTDEAFKKTAAYKRHRIMFSFTPANQLYSDYEESLKEKDD